tara:strand:+ start:4380 stop:6467 length:2088 start_codon:yes stop_codon:yes gene_type:complete
MEQNSTINVLIASELVSDGALLVSALRKDGYNVHAESVADESHLRERLLSMRWDLLFLFPGPQVLPIARLILLMNEVAQDICFISLGKLYDEEGDLLALPDNGVVCTKHDLNKPKEAAVLLRTVRHELNNLNTRRELRKTNTALNELRERYQLLLMSASDAVAYLHEGLFQYANQAYLDLFGLESEAQLKQHTFLDLVDEPDVERVRKFLNESSSQINSNCIFMGITAPNSLTRLSLECAQSVFEDEPSLQIMVRPVVGNIAQQKRQKNQESLDLLTNLLNRSAIHTQIDRAIAKGVYEQVNSASILLKLEEFQEFSILNGKSAANLLLADVARLISDNTPIDTVIGHLGDAEFMILLSKDTEYAQEQFLLELTTSLNSALHRISPQGVILNFSAGIAIINELSSSAGSVIDRARHNLTVHRNQSKNEAEENSDAYSTASEMFKRLEKAFEKEDFVLAFQPIVNLKEDGVERYEVRIRLQDQGKLIYPQRFLQLANQHGLGEKIDRWVCEQSLHVLSSRNNPALKLTINLTHNTIISGEFLPWLRAQLQSEHITADQISLQISELDIVSSPRQVKKFCTQVQTLGLILSLTHFGCTYTSLNSLPLEEATFVKLDKSLLNDLDKDQTQREKLSSVVSSLHARGLLVVAPMIDSIDFLPLLWQANVNFVQGNCLQEPSANLDFSFVQDEELTLDSFQ